MSGTAFRTNADRLLETPPGLVRETLPLLEWAQERARAVRELNARIRMLEGQAAETEAALAETEEWKVAEQIRSRLADAKKAAADRCHVVQMEREAAKKASKALGKVEGSRHLKKLAKQIAALRGARDEAQKDISKALADGKIPTPFELDPKVVQVG